MNYFDPIAQLLGEWSSSLNVYSIILRLSLSVLLSAVIGWERSSKRHAAGLRTFMLVSLASTVATILDVFLLSLSEINVPVVSGAAVIGIAIVGSNSILFSSRNQIKGLTTAFALWTSGLVGMTAGAGIYTVTVASFVFLLVCLSAFPPLEVYLKNRSNHFEIHLELKSKSNLAEFITTIRRLGLRIDDIESNPSYMNSGLSVYSVALTIISPELKKYKKHSEIIEAIGSLDYVSYIEEMS